MQEEIQLRPDYIFEVSWEVCNKVGGIYTVLATKTPFLQKEYGDQLIMIGPDVWKESKNNPEFIEDKTLFKLWRQHINSEGLKVKIGRWDIPGKPIAILVDFTPYFVEKNQIFTDLWVKYKLDSLSGQWDYIEPALFGYAAGKVIECFYRCHINFTDKVVAQFHEWMTGAGILYLKEKVPQIATIFTTHATVLGRCIAGNGLPFYSQFDSYNADQVANDFNTVSKFSLEKLSARNTDCFTTVSEITGNECRKFLSKAPDIITHNGFNPAIVPIEDVFEKKRVAAREKILQVCEALLCQKLDTNSLLVIKSGRYEFKNKGIDIFINSLSALSKSAALSKTIIGLIFVPAHQTGPRKELLARMENPDFSEPLRNEVLTHYLQGAENDPVIRSIKQTGLDNGPDKRVKIVFVPTYLDGVDGIFNVAYYDLLMGFDLSVFPSYYEPWGYTPLESIAFHIPAITTNISGFGMAVNSMYKLPQNGIFVVNRNDENESDVIANIAGIIADFIKKPIDEINKLRLAAHELSNEFSWEKQIIQYEKAYDFALQQSAKRESLFKYKPQAEPVSSADKAPESAPVWRSIAVHSDLPASLSALQKLSRNLWVTWHTEAQGLFEYIDTDLWHNSSHNPVAFLHHLSYEKMMALEKDKNFIKKLKDIEKQFDAYISASSPKDRPLIAYLCMEYGLDSYIKLYSGGLGILAGDYLKEASDQGINLLGIGLLYKNGYFRQSFTTHGDQIANSEVYDYASLPLQQVIDQNGSPLTIDLMLPGRKVAVHVWRVDIGRVPLYLLDTNVPSNSPEDQAITTMLYDSDPEIRLKQELLLGICSLRLLEAIEVNPNIFHCNEGHSAFIAIERIHKLIHAENLSYEEAFELVRSSTLYTTHTSIPAANDTFSEELLRKYLSHKPQYFNINWDILMGMGRADKSSHDEKFSMMHLAARVAGEINAVSKIHEDVSRHLLNPLWKDFKPEELPIKSVTNGVHYDTWTSKEWKQLYSAALGADISTRTISMEDINKLEGMNDDAMWKTKKESKKALLHGLKKRYSKNISTYGASLKTFQAINRIEEDALVIGFARRMVVYKRPDLIFNDIARLKKIVNNSSRPVRFLFAGKAHPNDHAAVSIIKNLLSTIEYADLEGKIIFLENYDMDLGKLLVQGVDLWLNTPYRGMEASGTSGMKAALNGVLNFSVLDGWWAEGYTPDSGWALPLETTYEETEFQNQLDAETIYTTLEKEIIPMFFDRSKSGYPEQWIKRIKTSAAIALSQYTTSRMIREYVELLYNKLSERIAEMSVNNFSKARELVSWKKKVSEHWMALDVISVEVLNAENDKIPIGQNFKARVVLEPGYLSAEDICLEVVFLHEDSNKFNKLFFARELGVHKTGGNEIIYECDIPMKQAGAYSYSFRLSPKHPLQYHKTEMGLAKWI